MASPASPNGKGSDPSERPQKVETAASVDRTATARQQNQTPLNSADSLASKKEERAREADEDRVLISQAQSGDQTAFRKLVDRHHRRAFAIAVGLVRDENDAREIVQEAFLRVYRGLATFEGGSSFFTWLYRIVTNLSIDLMRKPGRRAAELDESRNISEESEGELALVSRIDGADPVDVVRRKEMAGRIQSALDALPPYHRAVILMREVEGLSYEEMAEAMGVSKGTIMSRLFHARQKMQKALADVYEELGPAAKQDEKGRGSSDEKPADDES
ncbi:MAG: sigma-70 family RNA polymerase sigma factor [Polyangiaceae bacterium]|nr:sigma-70 family RNA polymerase sigma factor [Polyangiaceae bacterium]